MRCKENESAVWVTVLEGCGFPSKNTTFYFYTAACVCVRANVCERETVFEVLS